MEGASQESAFDAVVGALGLWDALLVLKHAVTLVDSFKESEHEESKEKGKEKKDEEEKSNEKTETEAVNVPSWLPHDPLAAATMIKDIIETLETAAKLAYVLPKKDVPALQDCHTLDKSFAQRLALNCADAALQRLIHDIELLLPHHSLRSRFLSSLVSSAESSVSAERPTAEQQFSSTLLELFLEKFASKVPQPSQLRDPQLFDAISDSPPQPETESKGAEPEPQTEESEWHFSPTYAQHPFLKDLVLSLSEVLRASGGHSDVEASDSPQASNSIVGASLRLLVKGTHQLVEHVHGLSLEKSEGHTLLSPKDLLLPYPSYMEKAAKVVETFQVLQRISRSLFFLSLTPLSLLCCCSCIF